MAKKQSAEPGSTIINVDLQLQEEAIVRIAASVEGDDSPPRKVGRVAMGLLEALASGGVMLTPLQVQRVQDAAGKELDAEDISCLAEVGSGRKDGQCSFTLNIEPAYLDLLRPVADFQGVTIEQVLQNAMDQAWDNGWLYADTPTIQLDRIVLTQKDRKRMETLINRKFTSGSDLVAGLAEALGEDVFGPAPEPEPLVDSAETKTFRSMTAEEWESLPEAEKRARKTMSGREWNELPEPRKRELIEAEENFLDLNRRMKGTAA
jgi:hypothetical protein